MRSLVESMKLILAAERMQQEQKSAGTPGLCPECAKVQSLSEAELISEIMELLETGRLKLPDGIQLEVREDDEDDPYGVG